MRSQWVTSKHLKVSLTLANANGYEPTIRRTLNNNGGKEKSHFSPKRTLLQFAKDLMNRSEGNWANVQIDG